MNHNQHDAQNKVLQGGFMKFKSISEWKAPTNKLVVYIAVDKGSQEENFIFNYLLYELKQRTFAHSIEVCFLKSPCRDVTASTNDWATTESLIEFAANESAGIFFVSIKPEQNLGSLLARVITKKSLDEYVASKQNPLLVDLVLSCYDLDSNGKEEVYLLRDYDSIDNGSREKLMDALSGFQCMKLNEKLSMSIGEDATKWEHKYSLYMYENIPRNKYTDCKPTEMDNGANDFQVFKEKLTSYFHEEIDRIISKKNQSNRNGSLDDGLVGEWLYHCEKCFDKSNNYRGDLSLVIEAMDFIMADLNNEGDQTTKRQICLGIVGSIDKVCCSKVALLARVASETYQKFVENSFSPAVIIRFCGLSEQSRSARPLVVSICKQIEYLFKLKQASKELESQPYNDLVRYFHKLLTENPVQLFLDSLNEIDDADQGRTELSFLLSSTFTPHPKTRIVVSCLPDMFEYDPGTDFINWKECHLVHTRLLENNIPIIIAAFDDEMLEQQTQNSLKGALNEHGRKLDSEQWDSVTSKLKVEPTSLYIELGTNYLSNVKSGTVVSIPSGVKELIKFMLNSVAQSSYIGSISGALIAFSSVGLTDTEMSDLLSLSNQFQKKNPTVYRISMDEWIKIKLLFMQYGLIKVVIGGIACWSHSKIRTIATEYFEGYKIEAQTLLGTYFADIVDSLAASERGILRQPLMSNGESFFLNKGKINSQRILNASKSLLGAGMYDELLKELISFEALGCLIQSGEGYRTMINLAMLAEHLEGEKKDYLICYLKWLKQDIGYLVQDPLNRIALSVTSEPIISPVRAKMIDLISAQGFPKNANCVLTISVPENFNSCIAKIEGHTSSVSSVAFTRDGTKVLSGSWDKTIKLWDSRTCNLTSTLVGHKGFITAVAFSQCGSYIISGSYDHTVKLWYTKSCTLKWSAEVHEGPVTAVAFKPDNEKAVSCSWDTTVKIWLVKSGECITTLKGHTAEVLFCRFHSKKNEVISGAKDNCIFIWDIDKVSHKVLKGHTSDINSVVYHTSQPLVVSGSSDNDVRLWSTKTYATQFVMAGHSDSVRCVAFSRKGDTIASSSADRTIRLWDTMTGAYKASFQGHSGAVYCIRFNHDDSQLVSGSQDSMIRIWDCKSIVASKNRSSSSNLGTTAKAVTFATYSTSGRLISVGYEDGIVRFWKASDFSYIDTWHAENDFPVKCIAWDSRDVLFAVCGEGGLFHMWHYKAQALVASFKGHADDINTVQFLGKHILVTGSDDNTVRVWNFKKTQVEVLQKHSHFVTSVKCSPDEQYIISAARDESIVIVNAITLETHAVIDDLGDIINDISSLGDTFYCAAVGCSVVVLHNNELFCTFEGHTHDVLSVDMSYDEKFCVSGSEDGTLRLWSIEEKACVAIMKAARDIVNTVEFSRDGLHVLYTSGGKIHQWFLPFRQGEQS